MLQVCYDISLLTKLHQSKGIRWVGRGGGGGYLCSQGGWGKQNTITLFPRQSYSSTFFPKLNWQIMFSHIFLIRITYWTQLVYLCERDKTADRHKIENGTGSEDYCLNLHNKKIRKVFNPHKKTYLYLHYVFPLQNLFSRFSLRILCLYEHSKIMFHRSNSEKKIHKTDTSIQLIFCCFIQMLKYWEYTIWLPYWKLFGLAIFFLSYSDAVQTN